MEDTSVPYAPQIEIQQVKDLIDSRQFVRALERINNLQHNYPSSAYLLALEALVYQKTGFCEEAKSICEDFKEVLLADQSVLPEVLNMVLTVCHLLGMYELATKYCKHACAIDPNNLDLLQGLFYCYHRESSFANQVEISFKMYDLEKRRMFLFWSVFSIQLQVCCQLIKKHMNDRSIDEPETLLVYIHVTEQQAMNGAACEILSKLGSTLLVAEVGKGTRIKGIRLLARVSDYIAAEEVLHEQLKSCPDVREQIINNMRDQSGSHTFFSYISQLSQSGLSKVRCDSTMSEVLKSANLRGGPRCDAKFNEAVDEYFNRHGSNAEVCLQVLAEKEELLLINNLLEDDPPTPSALRCLPTIHSERTSGKISQGLSRHHGTAIALKTKKFIILAADGKLTPRGSYDALGLKAEKVKDFNGICAAVTGDWVNSCRMLSTLNRCIKFLENRNKERPTARKFADFATKKLYSRVKGFGIMFGAFDKSKDDLYVPCIYYADESCSFEIKKSFFCVGTGKQYADDILLGEVRDDMEQEEAIVLVEKALAYANMCDIGCTGGWASIYVIGNKSIKAMPREHISSTLRRRHLEFLKKVLVRNGNL